MHKFLIVWQIVFEIVLNRLEIVVGNRLDLLNLGGLLQIEMRDDMVGLGSNIRYGNFRVWLDNTSLQHVYEPLRLHNNAVLHKCRLGKVRGETARLGFVSAIQRR